MNREGSLECHLKGKVSISVTHGFTAEMSGKLITFFLLSTIVIVIVLLLLLLLLKRFLASHDPLPPFILLFLFSNEAIPACTIFFKHFEMHYLPYIIFYTESDQGP